MNIQRIYNKYSPNKIIRRWLSRKIYLWADTKYGEKARGKVVGIKIKHYKDIGVMGVSDFTPKQTEMLEKWHYWMGIKNKIFWHETRLDKLVKNFS